MKPADFPQRADSAETRNTHSGIAMSTRLLARFFLHLGLVDSVAILIEQRDVVWILVVHVDVDRENPVVDGERLELKFPLIKILLDQGLLSGNAPAEVPAGPPSEKTRAAEFRACRNPQCLFSTGPSASADAANALPDPKSAIARRQNNTNSPETHYHQNHPRHRRETRRPARLPEGWSFVRVAPAAHRLQEMGPRLRERKHDPPDAL